MGEKNHDITSNSPASDDSVGESIIVNASGHIQEVERNFGLLSICSVGLTVGNVWPAVGGSILVAIYDGGPPGVLYEFMAISVLAWCMAASIAELSSAIPSSGAVYHWASVTPGPKYGRIVGFFAGYWNWLAWMFGCISMGFISGTQVVQMYALMHPEYVAQAWHVYIAFLISVWVATAVVCFANRALPMLNNLGMFFVIAGFFIIVILCAVMPSLPGHAGHASNQFVWTNWSADLGYTNDGVIFLIGMLNGAFAVMTPDVTAHMGEEIPNPAVNLPKAIGAQMAIGFVTGLCYLIALLYGINDLDALYEAAYPLAEIYRQATGSTSGAVACLVLTWLPIYMCIIGGYMGTGRNLWTLARDGATPFAGFLSKINKSTGNNPLNATVANGILISAIGAIYLGSVVAFNALVGSFIILISASYLAAILPHLINRSNSNVRPGPFYMHGALGYIINSISVAGTILCIVIFCFPYYLPVTVATMNYSCLIFGGCSILVAAYWFCSAGRKGSRYEGPPLVNGGGGGEAEKIKGMAALRENSVV